MIFKKMILTENVFLVFGSYEKSVTKAAAGGGNDFRRSSVVVFWQLSAKTGINELQERERERERSNTVG
jgi:hypothetical protein